MCGIFGVITNKNSSISSDNCEKIIGRLFELSESRGKEASGIAAFLDNEIRIYKEPLSASVLMQTKNYKNLFNKNRIDSLSNKDKSFIAIGHTRLVTNGVLGVNDNNQPIVKDGLVGVHNGIIVNDVDLWKKFPSLKRRYEVDTEVILTLIRKFLNEGMSLIGAVQEAFDLIDGSASVAVLFNDRPIILLATNTGSLYVYRNSIKNIIIFASEKYILKKLISKFENFLSDGDLFQVHAGEGYLIDKTDLKTAKFLLAGDISEKERIEEGNILINPNNIIDLSSYELSVPDVPEIQNNLNIIKTYSNLFPRYEQAINGLRRCTKCILPETFPFISFDEKGVCNYCHSYKKNELKGEDTFHQIAKHYRRKNDEPDCLVPFSGGRDSSYGLHYIKKVLKMNPVSYSYDWGMITDVGRRNQARMCAELGIEHILVSADIRRKRENIRKNVIAWLKRPALGMIPLFMAGDKQYFYYANQIKKQMGLELIIMCENALERTNFKHGFCGVRHARSDVSQYFMSLSDKLKLAEYYAGQFFKNPAYLNSTTVDAIFGFISYFFISHNYLYPYQFIKWDEKEIISTLVDNYGWEFAPDKKISWRNDDGTAPFYNYIYYKVAGFTENDTFRSNQIREEMISREEALVLARDENQPRLEAIKWYCDTIGLNFEEVLKIINSIPNLYRF